MNIENYEIFKRNTYHDFKNNGKTFLINDEPYLDIVLGDHCSLNCSFCIADLIHDKLRNDIDVMKEKVLFAVKNMRVKEVLLLGGEPTSQRSLIPMIEFLSKLGLNKIVMTTNGLKMARNHEYARMIFKSGLTHLNISFMNIDQYKQKEITASKTPLTVSDIQHIYSIAKEHGVNVRVNNNVFKGNNDSVYEMNKFYSHISQCCDSVKFSPLLKTDSFSVVDEKTKWVNENILSDKDYDTLFEDLENHYSESKGISIIKNNALFGFVKNTMIPLKTPIILNWNQHGKMMDKVVNEKKINNIKLLPNGELSLSWNREMKGYFIKTTNTL
jgi:molybdenum cofactor biosynthesis enzyme MoaA